MRVPRTRFSASESVPISSSPAKRADPTAPTFEASSPRHARKVCDFPEPDSPTTATHSPAATASETSCTTRCVPCAVVKSTQRPSSASRSLVAAISAHSRIERIAEPVAEKVQREEEGGQHRTWKQKLPGRTLHRERALRDQPTKTGQRLLHAQPEKTQEALEEDELRHGERGVDGDGAEQIRHDVARDDPVCGQSERDRGVDEPATAQSKGLTPDDTGHGQPPDRADRDEDEPQTAAKHDGQYDHEEHVRQRVENVDKAHHPFVDAAAQVTGGRPPRDADHEAHN